LTILRRPTLRGSVRAIITCTRRRLFSAVKLGELTALDGNVCAVVRCADDVLMEGLEELKKQKVSGSSSLNEKFQATGKFQMSYGSLSLFYGGLESLLGPPQMHKEGPEETSLATLIKAMENDHCSMVDSKDEFTTPNLIISTSVTEWEFVAKPKVPKAGENMVYPERDNMPANQRRRPIALQTMEDRMEEICNLKLRKDDHSELIKEELVGGRLYTGPMYVKVSTRLTPPRRHRHFLA
jgi:hypothetical protein